MAPEMRDAHLKRCSSIILIDATIIKMPYSINVSSAVISGSFICIPPVESLP